MAKNASSIKFIGIAVVAALAVLFSVPREVWIGIVVLGGIWFIIKLVGGGGKSPIAPSLKSETRAVGEKKFRIPEAPPGPADKATWIPAGQSTDIAGFTLPGGMIYVGTHLQSASGNVEPALINPKLRVSIDPVEDSVRLIDYWPSYHDISPAARRAFLQWLSGGRSNPQTNIGYVFLFFYGLERRVLWDAKHDFNARADIPAILDEVKRLRKIYGEINGSFRSYSGNFLEFARLSAEGASPVYQGSPPKESGHYELPLRMRLGLGQMALNKIPVPPAWAYAWAMSEPNISRRTPVTRCADVFEILFTQKYLRKYGDGFDLPVNRTQLKSGYRPASGGLLGQDFTLNFNGVPDITATSLPVGRLQKLVDECTEELDGYSRYLGRNPDLKESLDALLQLPLSLWPAAARSELEALKSRIGDDMLVMSFGELSGRLKSAGVLNREKVLGLARALESMHIGIEPDVLAGAKTPKAEDTIVLFSAQPEDGAVRANQAYQAAAVTIGLSHAVAVADGNTSQHEIEHLTRQADSWAHLSTAHRRRLKAYLQLQVAQPTPLSIFKKKLEPLAQDARRAIAQFLAHLAQVDGTVSPGEVRLLEKLYKSLGIDAQLLYADLHIAAAPGGAPSSVINKPRVEQTANYTLDPARIAALQKETEQVSSLLAGVFAEEQAEPISAAAADTEDFAQTPGLFGLDTKHSAFVRLLLSRPSWTRQDAIDAAADMELMLDGTLEQVNEAFFEHFEEALAEGDDPIEINQSLIKKMPA